MNDQHHKKIQQFTDLPFGCFSSDYYNNMDNGYKELVNFGLNDYLSISIDKRIKQFEEDKSPAYNINHSPAPFDLLPKTEDLLSQIFEKQVILIPDHIQIYSTILKSFSHKTDLFITDEFAQPKLQIAIDLLRKEGRYTATMPHNMIDKLEEQLIQHKNKHQHVWYLTSSIHSTNGSVTCIDKLERLLLQYEHLRVLIDDSHGLSWTGKNGQGYVFNSLSRFPQVIITASLCKGFGADGRVIICSNNKLRNILALETAPFRNSNAIETYTLNVIGASACIHLSPEIYVRQVELRDRIEYFHNLAIKLQLPIQSSPHTPIGFVYAGKPELCEEISTNMLNRGYFLSSVTYPTLPVNSSGLRIAISLYHKKDTIKKMLTTLKTEYEKSLKKRGINMQDMHTDYERQI
jgi:7-keto-8-aminopelargonate synthetase-like enzyme